MKTILKICDFCGFPRKIRKNLMVDGERKRACWFCYGRMFPTRLKKVSEKQQVINRNYRRLREKYLIEHPTCEYEGCRQNAVDLHHTCGRGIRTTQVETFMAVCREHHDQIHRQPEQSQEKGYWMPSVLRK